MCAGDPNTRLAVGAGSMHGALRRDLESRAMSTIEQLERLSTEELRERAFSRAKKRFDAAFFWGLLKSVPAAEAAAGHFDEAREDVFRLAERVNDLMNPDSPEEADAFRPIFIEYLTTDED